MSVTAGTKQPPSETVAAHSGTGFGPLVPVTIFTHRNGPILGVKTELLNLQFIYPKTFDNQITLSNYL